MKTEPHKIESTTSPSDQPSKITTRPVYWKQVLLTTFTVYPLLLGVTALLKLLAPMQSLQPELATLLAVLIVASLMVFPVMPLAMKLLGTWLHQR